MKKILLLLPFVFLTATLSFGQNMNVPRNIKQAVTLLNSDCSDSLKTIIKLTADTDLSALSYPFGEYKTIFNWTSDDNANSKIVNYLMKQGISYYDETVILIAFKQFLLGQKIDENSIMKPYREIEKKWAAEDKVRSTTDSLRGVYIPKNLEDCFTQIDSFWPDSTKTRVRQWTEDEFSGNAHSGFGRWMRNNWQLWGGSRLSKYFNSYGIYHPDDMSGIILDSYHRYLNNQAIQLDEQIKFYKDYWEKSKKQELESNQEKFSGYKIGDTVVFNYNLGYSTPEQEKKDDDNSCIAKGKILEKGEVKFMLRIKLIESCDKKGIIYYDNEDYQIYNKKTKKWEYPKKHIIKRMKNGQKIWFNYEDWQANE